MPSKYCAVEFASRMPTWKLHPAGGVADVLADGGEEVGAARGDHVSASCLHDGIGVDWAGGPGGGGTRIRRNRKSQAHLVRNSFGWSQSRMRVWKRLKVDFSQEWEHVDAKRRWSMHRPRSFACFFN